MADEEVLKRIEARLTRVEAAIAQGTQARGGQANFPVPGGTIGDPAPYGGGGGWGYGRPPIGNPIGDPAPWGGWGGWGGGWGIGRPPVVNPIGDPAPWGGWGGGWGIGRPPVVNPIGDPAPLDLGRLSLDQLKSSLHAVAAERARLDATEAMINERIQTLEKQG